MNALGTSGGKDSTATALFLIEKEIEFIPVFSDTGWEHEITLEYLEYLNEKIFNGKLVTIKSEIYPNGMRDLIKKKKRVPSAKARFCTGPLKTKPMIDWLYMQNPEIEIVYQGIRAEESKDRADITKYPPREFADYYNCYVERPILEWTVQQVFNIHKKHNIKPNPLYRMGASRVGCFPCVMCNHEDLKNVQNFLPEVWDRVDELEKIAGRSFFPPKYIPKRFHTGFDEKSRKSYPVASDVKKYLAGVESAGQISFQEPSKCVSIYNLCE